MDRHEVASWRHPLGETEGVAWSIDQVISQVQGQGPNGGNCSAFFVYEWTGYMSGDLEGVARDYVSEIQATRGICQWTGDIARHQ